MKNIIRKTQVLAFSTLLIVAGCKKLDINQSPNNPPVESATVETLFPSAVISTVSRTGGDLSIIGGIWAQYWTQNNNSSQFRTVDSYDVQATSNFINGPYSELFAGALTDYQLGITKSVAAQDWRYNLMNTVMKAYTYEVLVDLFDKVPYSEALKGGANLQPKFDDGYTIYTSLIAEIDAALARDYKTAPLTDAQIKTDFVFGKKGTSANVMASWEKFANTLKLKMYLRMVNAKPDEAQAGILKLYQDGAKFLDEDAKVDIFTDVPNKSNPFYEYNFRRLNTPDNLKASITFTSWLNQNQDPRAEVYYGEPNPVPSINQGDYLGGSAHPEYNDAVNVVVNATDAVPLISLDESYFMQAEARLRYFGGAGAENLYNEGVKTAFSKLGLDGAALLSTTYAYPASADKEVNLEAIIVQKWASLFGSHALEAFFEQNRTGYPKTSTVYSTDAGYTPGQLVYTPNGVTGAGNFPRRFVYPDFEKSRNANTPAQVPIYTKVWWGK
ncbi:SusD/RagB family nutrient-binding outer membrane lipoprotein [Pedobacter alluvionis]|uniref:SusD-like starch-binding protein associating with outer membrane n=1 Tax=Pedobacter alluvionis TaxID=475253 RepID=A0A497XY27_9SPHI|nr:SusD/RagB family nutrient-binding outer membrane lipoprotein [Pedobacter alluvionis]RLJ73627.1 SusD-like starch-binding protein associating with outer membrane [Pedobacter alluvionis]TFB32748.1 SusD/RagB family nutrient-binding outer membrane lipoprotein [Pedobacter alluvionis]